MAAGAFVISGAAAAASELHCPALLTGPGDNAEAAIGAGDVASLTEMSLGIFRGADGSLTRLVVCAFENHGFLRFATGEGACDLQAIDGESEHVLAENGEIAVCRPRKGDAAGCVVACN